MNYAKLAYQQAQDLTKRVNGLESRASSGFRSRAVTDSRQQSVTDAYELELRLYLTVETSLYVLFDMQLAASATVDYALFVNGVQAASAVGAGTRFAVNLSAVPSGETVLTVRASGVFTMKRADLVCFGEGFAQSGEHSGLLLASGGGKTFLARERGGVTELVSEETGAVRRVRLGRVTDLEYFPASQKLAVCCVTSAKELCVSVFDGNTLAQLFERCIAGNAQSACFVRQNRDFSVALAAVLGGNVKVFQGYFSGESILFAGETAGFAFPRAGSVSAVKNRFDGLTLLAVGSGGASGAACAFSEKRGLTTNETDTLRFTASVI